MPFHLGKILWIYPYDYHSWGQIKIHENTIIQSHWFESLAALHRFLLKFGENRPFNDAEQILFFSMSDFRQCVPPNFLA
jgi:hypothetical protein